MADKFFADFGWQPGHELAAVCCKPSAGFRL